MHINPQINSPLVSKEYRCMAKNFTNSPFLRQNDAISMCNSSQTKGQFV